MSLKTNIFNCDFVNSFNMTMQKPCFCKTRHLPHKCINLQNNIETLSTFRLWGQCGYIFKKINFASWNWRPWCVLYFLTECNVLPLYIVTLTLIQQPTACIYRKAKVKTQKKYWLLWHLRHSGQIQPSKCWCNNYDPDRSILIKDLQETSKQRANPWMQLILTTLQHVFCLS